MCFIYLKYDNFILSSERELIQNQTEEELTWITISCKSNNHELSNIGYIRNKTTKKLLKIKDGCIKGKYKGKEFTASVKKLLRIYFPIINLNEIWELIPNNSKYKISTIGNILIIEHLRLLKPGLKDGYQSVNLVNDDGKIYSHLVHRLMAYTFLADKKEEKHTSVNHINGEKIDNRLINLEWSDPFAQAQHKTKMNLNNSFRRAVRQLNLETSIFIKEYKSASHAARELNLNSSSISRACEGTERNKELLKLNINKEQLKEKYKYALNHTGGFKWEYVNPNREGRTEDDLKDLPGEEWKQYKQTVYYISNKERVKNISIPCIMKIQINNDNRKRITLFINNTNFTEYLHRLIAIVWIPNPDPINLIEIDHIDKDVTNNSINNLRWVTHQENINNSFAKKIDQFYLNGDYIKTWEAAKDIERELGFPHQGLSKCCNGKKKTYVYKDFIWKFHNEYYGIPELFSVNRNREDEGVYPLSDN